MERLQIERWINTRMLTGIPEHKVLECATLLENQRLYNETLEDVTYAKFKRLSVPLMRRIFTDNLNVEPFPLVFSQTQTKIPFLRELAIRSQIELDNECEIAAQITEDLKKFISQQPECFVLFGIGLNIDTNELIVFHK